MYTYLKYIKFGQIKLFDFYSCQAGIFTAHKRSLRRLCFYKCVSVHRGGACVVAGGACIVVGGMHGGGGCAWWQGACVVMGGVRGGRGSMHGDGGACVVAGGCA